MFIVLATLAALAVALAFALRRQVCLRRKDCCGKGCGCLFPKKAE